MASSSSCDQGRRIPLLPFVILLYCRRLWEEGRWGCALRSRGRRPKRQGANTYETEGKRALYIFSNKGHRRLSADKGTHREIGKSEGYIRVKGKGKGLFGRRDMGK